jgi:hypothetical protein
MAAPVLDERYELKVGDAWYPGELLVPLGKSYGLFTSDVPIPGNVGRTTKILEDVSDKIKQGILRKQRLPSKDITMGELTAMPGAVDYLDAKERFGKGRRRKTRKDSRRVRSTRTSRVRSTRTSRVRKTRRSRK